MNVHLKTGLKANKCREVLVKIKLQLKKPKIFVILKKGMHCYVQDLQVSEFCCLSNKDCDLKKLFHNQSVV